MKTMTIDEINALPRDIFCVQFADVAENTPKLAERAFEFSPFQSVDHLVQAFSMAMREMSKGEQLSLMQAHPDLAGKAALAGEVAHLSRLEQAGAGLDSLTEGEFEKFSRLNGRYREKFGFPFIFAVKGATKDMILKSFEDRVENDFNVEFEMALVQIERIFQFRIEDRIGKIDDV